jgi:hypothetical protein
VCPARLLNTSLPQGRGCPILRRLAGDAIQENRTEKTFVRSIRVRYNRTHELLLGMRSRSLAWKSNLLCR